MRCCTCCFSKDAIHLKNSLAVSLHVRNVGVTSLHMSVWVWVLVWGDGVCVKGREEGRRVACRCVWVLPFNKFGYVLLPSQDLRRLGSTDPISPAVQMNPIYTKNRERPPRRGDRRQEVPKADGTGHHHTHSNTPCLSRAHDSKLNFQCLLSPKISYCF